MFHSFLNCYHANRLIILYNDILCQSLLCDYAYIGSIHFRDNRYPSCIAAIVAITLTNAPLYLKLINDTVSGSTKSNNPVTLFNTVWQATISFRATYPQIKLITLITAIMIIQMISHIGMWIAGMSLIRHTTTKTKSAAESSFDPNSLTVPVFRATIPSIMSLTPAMIYKT